MISKLSAPSCPAPAGGGAGGRRPVSLPRLVRPALLLAVLATAHLMLLLLLLWCHRQSAAYLWQGWQPLMRSCWVSWCGSSTSVLARGKRQGLETPWKGPVSTTEDSATTCGLITRQQASWFASGDLDHLLDHSLSKCVLSECVLRATIEH